jgi:hypothetical protein
VTPPVRVHGPVEVALGLAALRRTDPQRVVVAASMANEVRGYFDEMPPELARLALDQVVQVSPLRFDHVIVGPVHVQIPALEQEAPANAPLMVSGTRWAVE